MLHFNFDKNTFWTDTNNVFYNIRSFLSCLASMTNSEVLEENITEELRKQIETLPPDNDYFTEEVQEKLYNVVDSLESLQNYFRK